MTLHAWHLAKVARGLGDGRRELVAVHCKHAVSTTPKQVRIVARCPHNLGALFPETRRHIIGPILAIEAKWWRHRGSGTWYFGTESPYAIDGVVAGATWPAVDLEDEDEPTLGRSSRCVSSPATCFEVLGVDVGASTDEIRRAFRRRATTAHPDRSGSTDGFVRLERAYREALAGVGAT